MGLPTLGRTTRDRAGAPRCEAGRDRSGRTSHRPAPAQGPEALVATWRRGSRLARGRCARRVAAQRAGRCRAADGDRALAQAGSGRTGGDPAGPWRSWPVARSGSPCRSRAERAGCLPRVPEDRRGVVWWGVRAGRVLAERLRAHPSLAHGRAAAGRGCRGTAHARPRVHHRHVHWLPAVRDHRGGAGHARHLSARIRPRGRHPSTPGASTSLPRPCRFPGRHQRGRGQPHGRGHHRACARRHR